VDADVVLMNKVITQTNNPTMKTWFDPLRAIFCSDSLSNTNEMTNFAHIGIALENVECSITEIEPEKCDLNSGQADFHEELNEPSTSSESADARRRKLREPITFVEPIPSVESPGHSATGCVYCNEENPKGWTSPERDPHGIRHPDGYVHYLTYSRKARHKTRECNLYHPGCQILSTARYAGCHRQTYTTMVRHEVILLYWHVTTTMRGPGAESYGKMIQELHRLGSGAFSEEGIERRLFVQADTLRSCIYGYLCRQRRGREGCPLCVGGLCKRLTVDAKKLRNPVHLNSQGISPDQSTPKSVKINCGNRCAADRYFLPGAQNKQCREAISSLGAALLGHRLKKGETAFNMQRLEAFSGVPDGYVPGLQAMADLWKAENPEETRQDGGLDDDEEVEAHGGLGDLEEPLDEGGRNTSSTSANSTSNNCESGSSVGTTVIIIIIYVSGRII